MKENEELACCACLTVKYAPIKLDSGYNREQWVCASCGMPFVKKGQVKNKGDEIETVWFIQDEITNEFLISLSGIFGHIRDDPKRYLSKEQAVKMCRLLSKLSANEDRSLKVVKVKLSV